MEQINAALKRIMEKKYGGGGGGGWVIGDKVAAVLGDAVVIVGMEEGRTLSVSITAGEWVDCRDIVLDAPEKEPVNK